MYEITIESAKGEQKKIQAAKGERIIDLLQRAGVSVSAPCGGRCFCGKCAVRVKGDASPMHEAEMRFLSDAERARGMRLACAACVEGELLIKIDESRAVILTDGGVLRDIALSPASTISRVSWAEPKLSDPRSDEERVLQSLAPVECSLPILRKLPSLMREGSELFIASFEQSGKREVTQIALEALENNGVAVDLGTTTLAAYLVNLDTGEVLEAASTLNPQRAHGGDVISRVDYTIAHADGLSRLASLVRERIVELAQEMAARRGVDANQIRHIVTVGNTIMMHILAAVEPRYIAVLPFTPAYAKSFSLPACELGMPFEHAMVTLGPCVAGYVGADTVAALLACDMDEQDGVSLMIDIGTNGEIALGGKDRMMCCSAAAGPAFEGAHIRCGSGAVAGAIDHVRVEGGEISVTTIGGGAAQSICGSGLVDAIAGMLREGIIDETGRIDEDEMPEAYEKYVTEVDGRCAVMLSPGVFICQKDVREVQLAKGAIAAGICILMDEMKVEFSDIRVLYLAGGFGNFIDKTSACGIGLLPVELHEKIVPIGNGAGAGARYMLTNVGMIERAEELRKRMEYVELSASADFQELFAERMLFE